MAILEIKKYSEPVLRQVAETIAKVGDAERQLFKDMEDAIRVYGGVGIAAPQVGVSKQMLVADTGEGPVYLANPNIVKKEGREEMEEGCLSLPEITVKVKRAKKIMVEGLDENSKKISLELDGLLARVVQHEIDHLNGILIVDYLGLIPKIFAKRRINRLSRQVKRL